MEEKENIKEALEGNDKMIQSIVVFKIYFKKTTVLSNFLFYFWFKQKNSQMNNKKGPHDPTSIKIEDVKLLKMLWKCEHVTSSFSFNSPLVEPFFFLLEKSWRAFKT